MKFCHECGNSLQGQTNFCSSCGAETSPPQAPQPTETRPMEQTELRQFQFRKIGEYQLSGEEVDRKVEEGIAVSERLPLVYAITTDQVVAYLGQTMQGYRRPLGYHVNEKMENVREGIREALLKGQTVEVFARSNELTMEREGLELNLREAMEKALTKKYMPEWNRAVDD